MAFPYLFFMLYKIKTFCLFCLGIDLLNLIALFLSLSLKPKWFSTDKLDFSKWKVFVTICTVSVALAVVGLTLTFHSPSANALEAEEMARRILDSPVFPVNNPNNDKEEFLSFGPKTAPITIVEFSDFQCPFCRIGALSLNSAISRYPDQIRVIFRNFPLDSTCNASVHQTVHPVACEAARVAICAHQKDRFEPIYQELFENQAMFKPGYPTQIARLQGFSLPSLEKCMDSAETNFAITKDIEDAKLLQVESTPTFFINGHKHAGVLSVPVWIKVIDHLLTK
jgi:protein-disulfide isomerase